MTNIEELMRLPSPAPFPQALAHDGELLWMGSRETQRLYAIDPRAWTVKEEAQAPGVPYGMTCVGDELRVLCGETEEDHRIIRRFIPGHGFRSKYAIECPDDTGSYLGFDGDRLYVSQWDNKRIISLDEHGHTGTIVEVPHGICGQVVVEGCFYLATTDDEETNEYLAHARRCASRKAPDRRHRADRFQGALARLRRRAFLDESSRKPRDRRLRPRFVR